MNKRDGDNKLPAEQVPQFAIKSQYYILSVEKAGGGPTFTNYQIIILCNIITFPYLKF